MPDIGPYSLHSIETGTIGLDGGAMFGIVPKPLWSDRIAPDERNRIPLQMRCLLMVGDDRRILIDTGIGDTFEGTKYQDIYAVDQEEKTLEASLRSHGVRRSDITDVILTHLHFDHCGGATRRTEEGHSPTFPNATYHVQAEHWAWACTSNPKEQASFVERTFQPIDEAGQLHRVEGEGPLLPAIDVMRADGHTNAQQIVKVKDENTTLVYVADLLPTTHHAPDAWTMAYDIRPLVTIEEKADFLERAAKAEWNLFFEHDPDTAVASLAQTDRGVRVVDPRPLASL
jgi:glyoxylase-like metal-dependent hydrolase (beta-lactamase superfamily II)